MKAKEIAARIEAHYGKQADGRPTCDGFVFGSPETDVTGVVTTFTVTAQVMEEARRLGANMIVTHEPTFFLECRGDWSRTDKVFAALREMAEKNGLVIWRCHDMMHAAEPDDIYSGFLQAIGWQELAQPQVLKNVGDDKGMENFIRDFRDYYDIPEMSLFELATLCREKLGMPNVRIAGDMNQRCRRVAVLVGGGSQGFGRMPDLPLKLMQEHNIDTILCGEIFELLLGTYMQDAAYLGLPGGMIVLGHERSEEWGMQFMQTWMRRDLDVPVHFVNAGEPFGYIH